MKSANFLWLRDEPLSVAIADLILIVMALSTVAGALAYVPSDPSLTRFVVGVNLGVLAVACCAIRVAAWMRPAGFFALLFALPFLFVSGYINSYLLFPVGISVMVALGCFYALALVVAAMESLDILVLGPWARTVRSRRKPK